MKRTLRVLLALAIALPLLASCGPKKRVVRVANFMTDPILIGILADQVKQIEKQNPGLEVRLESIPYSDYQQKILTQCAAHNAPDVLYVEVNNFVNLFYPGIFENLNPYVEKDRIDLKKFYPGVVGRFSRDGRLLAIPQDTAPTGLVYYNKKVFREVGLKVPDGRWSWPEPFLSICQKLTKRDVQGRITRFAFCDPYATDIGSFVYSNGAGWVDNVERPTKCTIASPAFLRAARFRWDLIHTYHVSPNPSQLQTFSSGAGVENMFANGQVAMMASGLWHVPKFLKEPGLEFDVAPFPKGPGGKKGWGSGGSGYALNHESKNKEDAWMVIRALTGEETVRRMAATGFLQPALIAMAESDAFLKSPGPTHKAVLLKMPSDARYLPFQPHWNEIQYGMIGPAMDRVWNGDEKPEPVLRELADKINRKYFSNN